MYIELMNEHMQQDGARFFFIIRYSFARYLWNDHYVQELRDALENKPNQDPALMEFAF